jgi:hypothetical protein
MWRFDRDMTLKCPKCGADQGKFKKVVFHYEGCKFANWSLL